MNENQIYTSTQYDDFTFKLGNRDVNEKHIKKIEASMREKGWMGGPIEVSIGTNGKFEIEEGQHRFISAKRTHTPIKFIVVPKKTIYEIAKQNSMVEKWKRGDFIKSYAEQGIQDYIYLYNLTNEFQNISISNVLRIVGLEGGFKKKLEEGRVKISAQSYQQARRNLAELGRFSEILKANKISEAYVKVLCTLVRKNLIDVNRMAEKLEKYARQILIDTTSTKIAAENLEKIYNLYQKNDVVYFMDSYKKAMR